MRTSIRHHTSYFIYLLKRRRLSEIKLKKKKGEKSSVAGTWTRVFRVRAEYPDQLDYNGLVIIFSIYFYLILIKEYKQGFS